VCARCGAFTCTTCEVSVQGVRYCDACRAREVQTFTAPIAWEERQHLGRLRAWWRTTAAVTSSPARFFERMGGEGLLGPLAFALSGAVLHQTVYVFRTCLGMAVGAFSYATLGLPMGAPDWKMLALLAGTYLSKLLLALVSPLLVLGLYLLVALCQHLALRLVDAGEERGATATLQVACYAFGVGWIGLVPAVGPLAFAVWWTTLMVVGTSRVHRRSPTRTLVVTIPSAMLVAAPFAACTLGLMFGLLSPI